jgi:hypothetical protein
LGFIFRAICDSLKVVILGDQMRPKQQHKARHDDLFRARLDQIINMKHELVVLANKIDWAWLDEQLADRFSDRGRPAEPVRFMIGMFLLKHTYGLSDEQVWDRWVNDPYFQYFTGEEFFQHALAHERSGMSHWRKRIGDRLDILLQESLRLAHDSGALKKRDLARVFRSGQKRGVHGQIKRELRRRSAIEPVIGHCKTDGHLERNYLTLAREALGSLVEQLRMVQAQIQRLEKKLLAWHRSNEASRRLAAIPGVGVITATALVATVGDASQYRSGRQLAAWLGLVPKQSSSGGKERLGRISKRGDGYLRRLLVHGARAALRWSKHRK